MVTPSSGRAGEVFRAFLLLGLTSFGGPIAHLGYFRTEFVARRQWLDEHAYADLVALCQFLPGPASSQVGFSLGLMRAGPLGALAAWTAFTLPSAILLVLFALGAASIDGLLGSGLIHGLRVVAVAIVAHAVWGMAKTLCPDRQRATIAVLAVLLVIGVGGAFGQVSAIVMGALAGLWVCRDGKAVSHTMQPMPVSRRTGMVYLAAFIVLLAGLPMLTMSGAGQGIALVDAFYRAGALVFGGGHVVLPLLEAEVVQSGWMSASDFLAGYGAAQAIPGPLFTFAAYLGMALDGGGVLSALLALVAIFVPGMLLLLAALPFWNTLRVRPGIQAVLRGVNAAVVGLLGAALYHPVWTSAILGPREFALALVGFALLAVWKLPPWVAVLVCGLGGMALGAGATS
ncbi:chromate efflux transporter [Halomonas urumqiensis]|uniref:Chromate transporter n=1 Tax=Halomonas urumqiensis TaxID=1684789 RepID=A0A2N7UMQ5_9GAMM|nr:chromate efflux transporter [Halomonas urumqiensis]PMR81708.1 chromate transporter [Halomonas urumqiensis]PTB02345.1 chromate transporter [Halomonas urumqiensis]GHE21821.1 chromate transporter [Halomonas urumqiensis]